MSPTQRPRPSGRPARLAGGLRLTAPLLAASCAVATPALAAAAAPAPAPVKLQAAPPAVTLVAAGRGHVVASETVSRGGSRLVELTPGKAPREIARFAGDPGRPTVGTDASGRTVVVLSPCLEGARPTPLPDCNLAVVDLATGRSHFLPRSKGAYLGDLDGRRAVVARRSASSGVRVALTSGKGTVGSRSLPLGSLLPARGDAGYPAALRHVDSIDLSRGTIAATFLWGMSNGGDGGGSVLARTTVEGRGWTELAHSGYGGASGILRVFRAATVTPTGVRAMFDGGDNENSYVARWTAAGEPARQRLVKPSFLASAAFDGDRLVTVDAEGPDCSAATGACGVVRTAAPGLG